MAATIHSARNMHGKEHVHDHKAHYPLAGDAVNNNCYMDVLMPSLKTVEEAEEAQRQLSELEDKAGFHIQKWISQRPELIADIPETALAALRWKATNSLKPLFLNTQ